MIRLCAAFYLVQPTDIHCTDAGTRGATQGIEETCTWLRISKGMKRIRRKVPAVLWHVVACCGMCRLVKPGQHLLIR